MGRPPFSFSILRRGRAESSVAETPIFCSRFCGLLGVLRLRFCSASLRKIFAQDDNSRDLLIAQGCGGESAACRPGRVQSGDERYADRDQGYEEAVDGTRRERDVVDRVDLG